jgi:hypothetical protein
MDGVFLCWIGPQMPRDYLMAWELLETGGVDLTAGRGEFLQKVFCHYTQSLPNPFASMAPCCKG